MEKKHKDLLIVQRANLVDNLNMRSGLFTQLLCRKIIDQRMVRKIKNGNTEDEQAEELLDYLPKSDQGDQTFDLFCEALIADSQGNIVKTYLRPDNDDTVRESNSKEAGLQETAGNSREESASEGKGSKCSESSSEVDFCKDGDRVVGSPSNMVPIAIREEFQQNLYRRSIEPRSLQHSQSADCFQSNLEHEARFLYQNSLRNPSAVLNSQGWGRTEKENHLLNMGVPMASMSKGMGDHYCQRMTDPLVARDGACAFPLNSLSSKDYPEKSLAQPPNVFSVNPQKEIHTSSISNGSRSNLESFSVYERDSVGPFSQPVFSDSRLNGTPMDKYVVRQSNNELDLNSIRRKDDLGRNEVSLGKLNYNIHRESLYNTGVDKGIHHSMSSPALQEMYHSPSRYTSETTSRGVYSGSPASRGDYSGSQAKLLPAQHDLLEMPRYIEVNSTAEGSLQRRMVPFPSHISTLPASRHPDLQTEELLRGENIGSPRLLRNDSVDTMVKRPLSEQQETVSKRFREDVDTCNIQNIPRPEKLTTLKVFDKFEQQVIKIPVIDEPVKKHSLPTVVIEADKHLEKSQRSSLLGAMDDPEIDLTDGPISVSVELSTRQFYLTHYKQAYAMRRIPRGKALIMNVNEVVGKSARRGTDIDRDNLHNLLCQMHFDVVVYNDSDGLTAMEMVQKLQDFSQHPAHANADCTIVCILSHGEEGYIFGADGKKFELDAVFSLFDNTCCPNLRGKPKVFIIQACRGGALDRGVQYYPDEHDGADARVRQVPSMSDMLICYPTQNGYYAWRNRDRGSWYVEALVQIFMKYARCEDICTMLNRVNLLVSKKVSHCPNIDMDQMSQMSEYKSTLRMPHLYFFPGIGGCS